MHLQHINKRKSPGIIMILPQGLQRKIVRISPTQLIASQKKRQVVPAESLLSRFGSFLLGVWNRISGRNSQHETIDTSSVMVSLPDYEREMEQKQVKFDENSLKPRAEIEVKVPQVDWKTFAHEFSKNFANQAEENEVSDQMRRGRSAGKVKNSSNRKSNSAAENEKIPASMAAPFSKTMRISAPAAHSLPKTTENNPSTAYKSNEQYLEDEGFFYASDAEGPGNLNGMSPPMTPPISHKEKPSDGFSSSVKSSAVSEDKFTLSDTNGAESDTGGIGKVFGKPELESRERKIAAIPTGIVSTSVLPLAGVKELLAPSATTMNDDVLGTAKIPAPAAVITTLPFTTAAEITLPPIFGAPITLPSVAPTMPVAAATTAAPLVPTGGFLTTLPGTGGFVPGVVATAASISPVPIPAPTMSWSQVVSVF